MFCDGKHQKFKIFAKTIENIDASNSCTGVLIKRQLLCACVRVCVFVGFEQEPVKF